MNPPELLLLVAHLDDVEELCLVLWTENSAGDLTQELLQDGGDGVHRKAKIKQRYFKAAAAAKPE